MCRSSEINLCSECVMKNSRRSKLHFQFNFYEISSSAVEGNSKISMSEESDNLMEQNAP
jgi:hypothetical protein